MGGNPFKSDNDIYLSSRGDCENSDLFQEFVFIHMSGNKENNVQEVNIRKTDIGEVKLNHDVPHELAKSSGLLIEKEMAVLQVMSKEKLPNASRPYLFRPVQQDPNPCRTEKLVCLLENVTLEEMKKKSHYVKKTIKEKVTNWLGKKFIG